MSDTLFSNAHMPSREPLAARMRPRSLDEYIGQDHIVGKGRLLRRAIAADRLSSVIFYGPPGTGKTTLARVIANHTKSNFITLNAVLTGVADIRTSIKSAEDFFNLYNRKTILFVDEVHRWNKSQQDALLPWVENGTIILIGATTENPFFEVNKALVSRSRIFQLKPLTRTDLEKAATQALTDKERGYGNWKVVFEEGALEHLIDTANGDARTLLNALELAVETTPSEWNPNATPPVPPHGTEIYISCEACEESIQKKVVLYDRDGDYHYDIISAFIKSLRGRDPDAAMYWLARMVRAGEDPHFIFRRMLISSCEDTGLADPHAISVVQSCSDAFDRVGLPEGRYFLAHAALYLSTAPKSNSSMAFFDALSSVEKEDAEVPNHLRDGNRDAEGFGHGEGYMYPHAYRDHWVAQQYLPDALVGRVFYTPSTQGYENAIRAEVLSRREMQIATILEDELNLQTDESLTFTPANKKKESALTKAETAWRARLDSNRAEVLLTIRDKMLTLANLVRHHRVLVWNADDGLLLWEACRKTPEGITCGVCRTEKGKAILEQYGRTLDELDRPEIVTSDKLQVTQDTANSLAAELKNAMAYFAEKDVLFDRVFMRDVFTSRETICQIADTFAKLQANNEMTIIIAQRIPRHGQRLSELISRHIANNNSDIANATLADASNGGKEKSSLATATATLTTTSNGDKEKSSLATATKIFADAEESFFSDENNSLFNWDAETVTEIFRERGLSVTAEIEKVTEKRRISSAEIGRWFDESSPYGSAIAKAFANTAVPSEQNPPLATDTSTSEKNPPLANETSASEHTSSLSQIISAFTDAAEKSVFDWKSEMAYLVVEVAR